MEHQYDVIIVGAGAAGIACAQKLHREQKDFLLIEARDRIGGRILSLNEPDFPIPIELGAEFIHGAPVTVLDWMRRFHIPFYDVQDEHLMLNKGKLQTLDDFFAKLDKVTKKIRPGGKDQSVANFIGSLKSIDKKTRDLFTAFVEGFHSADLNLMGTQALLATAETDEDSLNGSQQFRPLIRYDSFLQRILDSLALDSMKTDRLRLQTKLVEIEWEKRDVRLKVESGPQGEVKHLRSRQIVLTVPIGVLRSDHIQWKPFPASLARNLSSVHMGHVQKIIFRFRDRFWEELSKEKPTSFFHTGPGYDFPTWWSMQPLRTPHLVAWQGGPRAQEMGLLNDEERLQLALKTLSAITGRPVSKLNAEIEAWHTHNWSQDPFTLGAYSYVGVEGMSASRQLAKSIEDTIFLAGEGITKGSERGTVHGAIESGISAAKRMCVS